MLRMRQREFIADRVGCNCSPIFDTLGDVEIRYESTTDPMKQSSAGITTVPAAVHSPSFPRHSTSTNQLRAGSFIVAQYAIEWAMDAGQ
jgi:hypothetical protein